MLFDAVRERLADLIGRFGLEARREAIQEAYRLLFRQSMAQDTRVSRLNADGTPIQFSLALAVGCRPALQFLGEAGGPGATMEERMQAGREAMERIARLMGVEDDLAGAGELIGRMAPEADRALTENRSGVYWIGVSFPPEGAASLTVYINAKWGSAESQWERMRAFAGWFGAEAEWALLEGRLRGSMDPLGAAVTVTRGHAARGRIYASAYGLPLAYYQRLMGDFPARFAAEMLGEEDCGYPLRSSACSFETETGGAIRGKKFELCAHCAFVNDAEAADRVRAWLEREGSGEGLYSDVLEIVGRGAELSRLTPPALHAYVGVGLRGSERYTSVYLNPGPAVRGD